MKKSQQSDISKFDEIAIKIKILKSSINTNGAGDTISEELLKSDKEELEHYKNKYPEYFI